MTTDEHPEPSPEPTESPAQEDLGRFEVVYRKKPYLIAETVDGYELWDTRFKDAPIRTYASESYEQAEADLAALAAARRRRSDRWFRRAVLVFVACFSVLVIDVALLIVGLEPSWVSLAGGVYLLVLITQLAFGLCLVAWLWQRRDAEGVIWPTFTGARRLPRWLTAGAVAGLIIWGASRIVATILWEIDRRTSDSLSFGGFPEASAATTVAQVTQAVAWTAVAGCIGGLVLLFLFHAFSGSGQAPSPETLEAGQ